MGTADALILIDTNQYLDFYQVTKGIKLLKSLEEQKNYIFVTSQIVEEVQRNKLQRAKAFFTSQLEKDKLGTFQKIEHFFEITGTASAELHEQLKEISKKINEVSKDLSKAAAQTLQRISRSEDGVSKALATIFHKAIMHTPEELQRARERRERGNPPGKKSDPLGDQLTWEQLLSCYKDTPKQLWIISKDSDYWTKCDGEFLLNPILYQDLERLKKSTPDVVCFDNIVDGIRDFVKVTKVRAKSLPSPKEAKEIKEELDSLPPLGWLSPSSSNNIVDLLSVPRLKESFALLTLSSSFPLGSSAAGTTTTPGFKW